MSPHFTAIESITHLHTRDDAGRTSHPTPCASQAPADILVDGIISYMFGSRISEWYFEHLLKGRMRRSLLRWDVPGWPGACFASQVSELEIPAHHEHPPAPARLLDYDVRGLGGTVVPQALWCPQGQGATKKYVLDATLQWPVFFVREDHTVGLSLQEAVEGPRRALLGAQTRAQLGERSTLHVRIKVRTRRSFSHPLFLPGQVSGLLGMQHRLFAFCYSGLVTRYGSANVRRATTPTRRILSPWQSLRNMSAAASANFYGYISPSSGPVDDNLQY